MKRTCDLLCSKLGSNGRPVEAASTRPDQAGNRKLTKERAAAMLRRTARAAGDPHRPDQRHALRHAVKRRSSRLSAASASERRRRLSARRVGDVPGSQMQARCARSERVRCSRVGGSLGARVPVAGCRCQPPRARLTFPRSLPRTSSAHRAADFCWADSPALLESRSATER